MIFRAGFALNIAGSLVNGLMPFRERHLVSAHTHRALCAVAMTTWRAAVAAA